ncbi:MAG: gfo/Idh/MocA family oxidoreductase [Candidatus Omnitrophota bacterium]|jgi:predicted dehydrogenase|nr:MAG: gfo/Idh/MocA family oxidoreductase [Candidatus Omnitrophota bacterium]
MINVAIIGAGGISRTHIETYRKFPQRCNVTALADVYPEKAEKKKEELGLDVAVYGDYGKILDDADIGLVSVCVPPYVHAEISAACLRAGKHVICEKPMASSLVECDAMLAAQETSGKVLAVIAQNRYRSEIQKLKAVLDSGVAGRVLHAQVDSLWWRGHCYYDLWWRGTWAKEGGGCTLNHAVHHIDMFQWMMGLPAEVRAVMSNTAHDNAEVEDISIAILKYANGSVAQITSSVVHHGEEQQLVFQTEKARLSFPWNVYASKSRSNGFPDEDPDMKAVIEEYYRQLPDLPFQGYEGEFNDVLTAIETGGDVLMNGREGRKTLELITAIYQSASTDQTVRLPLTKASPFYTAEGIQRNAIHFNEKKASVENFGDDNIIVGSSREKFK